MKIQSLSYLLVETTNLQEWADYAKDVVGLMKNDSLSDEENLYLRMDEKSFRFHIKTGDSKKFLAAGFSLADSGMIRPPAVFSSPSIRRTKTRSCNGVNAMKIAPFKI